MENAATDRATPTTVNSSVRTREYLTTAEKTYGRYRPGSESSACFAGAHFPSVPTLRSTSSAADCSALFAGFAAVESGEVELAPCLRPLAQTARAVFPQAAFLCGRHCGVEDGLMPGTR